MKDVFFAEDAHAYVDSCLEPLQRREFEAHLSEDADLRRRVDVWHSQNEAIRLAFGAAPKPRGALSVGRPTNQNSAVRGEFHGAPRRPSETQRSASGAAPKAARATKPKAEPRRIARWSKLFSVAAVLWCLGATGGPVDARNDLMKAAASALRAFATPASAPLDISTRDPRTLTKWLATKFPTAPRLGTLEVPGWNLIGARVVPGVNRAAALILFEDERHERLGLLVEPMDAPPMTEARTRQFGGLSVVGQTGGGYGIAAVGASFGAVANLIGLGEPSEPPYRDSP